LAWAGPGRYADRVAALSAPGGALAGGAVTGDSDADALWGRGDFDWFFGDSAIDALSDRRPTEHVRAG
jgi:hypothetical protein